MMDFKKAINTLQTKGSGAVDRTVAPVDSHQLANDNQSKTYTGQIDPRANLTKAQIEVLDHQPQNRAETIQALVRAQGPMTALKNAGLGAVAGYLIGGSSLSSAALGATAGGLYGGYKNRVNAANTLNTYNATLDANDLNASHSDGVNGAINAELAKTAQLPLTQGQSLAIQNIATTLQQNPYMSPQAADALIKQISTITADASAVFNQRGGSNHLQSAYGGTPFPQSSPTPSARPASSSKATSKGKPQPTLVAKEDGQKPVVRDANGAYQAGVSLIGKRTKIDPRIVGRRTSAYEKVPVIYDGITAQELHRAYVGGNTDRQNNLFKQQEMADQNSQFKARLGEDSRQANQAHAMQEKNYNLNKRGQLAEQAQRQINAIIEASNGRPTGPQAAEIARLTRIINQSYQQ
jgi:hypothetical protein